jgi:fluoroacetyl-CoA thioesterase
MSLETGMTGASELEVTESDTAIAMGSGDVPVLATPRVIALCESAAMEAVKGSVGADQTTVAFRVQLDHLRPSAVGEHIRAEAHLDKIEGQRLIFGVSAKDKRGLVAAGKVTRVVVDVDRFLEKTR